MFCLCPHMVALFSAGRLSQGRATAGHNPTQSPSSPSSPSDRSSPAARRSGFTHCASRLAQARGHTHTVSHKGTRGARQPGLDHSCTYQRRISGLSHARGGLHGSTQRHDGNQARRMKPKTCMKWQFDVFKRTTGLGGPGPGKTRLCALVYMYSSVLRHSNTFPTHKQAAKSLPQKNEHSC